MDSDACNYDPDATIDDGSCAENDCAGECGGDAEDCAGECGGNAEYDDCGECNGDGSSCETHSIDIYYASDADIAGFQFNMDGVTVLSASGGDAEANGFTVSTSATTVLGFSFTGSVIPAGSGVLTILSVEGNVDDACIVDLVLSDAGGNGLDAEINDCLEIVYEGFADDGGDDGDDGGDDGGGDEAYIGLYEEDGLMAVVLVNPEQVAGFQFNVNGASASGASGGAAEEAGFTVSANGAVVLGFSFTGSVVPAGCGTLTSLASPDKSKLVKVPQPAGTTDPVNEKPNTTAPFALTVNPASSAAPPEAPLADAPFTLN
jgi:hypothetical protein